ncbi:UNVERIFIED_CONTAM: hypothetical protein RMT77_000272 [Armadillidium vulgare]
MASARSTADMSDMEVKRLNNAIRRRKLLRNRVTKSICESNKILNNSHPNLGTLIAHFNNLRGIETELNKVNAIIQQSLNNEALSTDDEECFRCYMTIIYQTVHINLRLEKFKGDFTFNPAPKVSRDSEILNPSAEQLEWFHKKRTLLQRRISKVCQTVTALLKQGPSLSDLRSYSQILENLDIEFKDVNLTLQQSCNGETPLSGQRM